MTRTDPDAELLDDADPGELRRRLQRAELRVQDLQLQLGRRLAIIRDLRAGRGFDEYELVLTERNQARAELYKMTTLYNDLRATKTFRYTRLPREIYRRVRASRR